MTQTVYVTVLKLATRYGHNDRSAMAFAPPTEDVILHHESMAELLSYLEYHNLVIGTPQPNTPYVHVEHIDGSLLSEEERKRVLEVASEEKWRSRRGISNHFYDAHPLTGKWHADFNDDMRRRGVVLDDE